MYKAYQYFWKGRMIVYEEVDCRISAAVLAFTGVASAVPGAVVTAADSNSKYNYGEALQKSMFFYEVQQSGVSRTGTRSAGALTV